ncbi:MAG: hypothetical protein U9O98_01660 [Asgard group archaeon]|nr:hypothetical protein [Asgard group archaeon]
MSYVEKSTYRYLKNILTSGIKALFSKRFLIYTFFFLVVTITTTIAALLVIPTINLTIWGIPPEIMIRYLFYGEIAFSITYVLVGLFFARTPMVLHISILIILASGIITGFYYLDDYRLVAILGVGLFCVWMIITLLSSYSFSKNLFGSKVTGSILFMGKKEGGIALFGGIMTLLILICMGLDGYIIYQGIITHSFLYLLTGSVSFVIGIIIILAIWFWAKNDDIYYTIIAFFYLLANSYTIQLFIRLLQGSVNYIAWLNIVLSIFFLLNSISKYYRKIERLDTDFLPENKKIDKSEEVMDNKKQLPTSEEFFISDMFNFISDRGVIMIILGFAFGYHSVLLQIGVNRKVIAQIFEALPSGIMQTAFSITILSTGIIVLGSLLLYHTSNRFRNYTSPQIFRLHFLPPYEQLEKFVINAKTGEIDWKHFAKDASITLAKKGAVASSQLAEKSLQKLKEKTTSVMKKTKEWGKELLSKSSDDERIIEEPEEELEEKNDQK